MVDAIPASDTENRRYLSNTPEHPYIPYDTPSAYGRARIGGADGRRERGWQGDSGGISAVIRDHPVPFVMFAASAGILLAGFASEYNLIIKAGLVLVILVLQSPRISAEWRLWRDSHRASRDATLRRQA